MPVYESNKEVDALKIATIARDADNCVTLGFEEEGHPPTKLSEEFCEKVQNTSSDMGYYVVDADGSESWMSCAIFDSMFSLKQS